VNSAPAALRPWAEFRARSVAEAHAGAWKFPPFIYCDGLLPPGDYSNQMLRLVGTTASWILMLKLFYFISDVVPC